MCHLRADASCGIEGQLLHVQMNFICYFIRFYLFLLFFIGERGKLRNKIFKMDSDQCRDCHIPLAINISR